MIHVFRWVAIFIGVKFLLWLKDYHYVYRSPDKSEKREVW